MESIKEEIDEDDKLSFGKCEECDHTFKLLSYHRWLYHGDTGGVLKERGGDDEGEERVYNREEDVQIDWDDEDGIPQCVFCGCHFPNRNGLFDHLLALHDPTNKISQEKDGEGKEKSFGDNERGVENSLKEGSSPDGVEGKNGVVKRFCHICQQSDFECVFSLWDHLETHPILHVYPCTLCPFTAATRLAMVIHSCKRRSKRLCSEIASRCLRESVELFLNDISDSPDTFENGLMEKNNETLSLENNNNSRTRTTKKKSSPLQKGKMKEGNNERLKVVIGRQSIKRRMWETDGGNKCSICRSTFKDKRAFLEHRLVEHRHFICPECGKQLRNRKTMNSHLANIHGPGRYLLQVPLDLQPNARKEEEKEISSTVKLELNAATLLVCTMCDFKTHLRYKLEEHRRNRHKGPYRCQTCSKSFSLMSSLDAHCRATHDERYCFQCNSCSTVFKKKLLLLNHLKNGRNKCPICKGFYPCVKALEEHADSMHSFDCSKCDKSFETLRMFRHHNTNVHGIQNRFKCQTCGHATNSDFNLKRHKRRVHRERLSTLKLVREENGRGRRKGDKRGGRRGEKNVVERESE